MLTLSSPIIQAPMAGVQGSALAIAVSAAGGLGSLPCAMLTPDAIRQEVARIREHTDRPFNLNFFCHTTPPRDDAREADWRRLLAPYYSELGVEPAIVRAQHVCLSTPTRCVWSPSAGRRSSASTSVCRQKTCCER